MLQRGGLIVPLGEVAHDRPDVDVRMRPIRARPPLVCLHDVTAHDEERHAVAQALYIAMVACCRPTTP